MHSTKTQILFLLKRSDGSSVDDLSSSLQLAPMTIRQHLMALERDTLVESTEVRRSTGRPHYHYRLTGEGHRQVSGGYDRMLALLVDQAGALDTADVTSATPELRRTRLFRRAAQTLAERHAGEVRRLAGSERAERIVLILREHGGFAEWHQIDGGFELRDFNCIFRATVAAAGPCGWHDTFLSELLNEEIEGAAEPDGCAACCRYIIRGRPTAPASV